MKSIAKLAQIFAAAAVALMISMPQSSVGHAQDSSAKLNLTMEQRHVIKENLKSLKPVSNSKARSAKIGQTIPKSIKLQMMPTVVSEKISQIKNYVFFLGDRQIVLVDPKNNRVIEIIDLQ